ncbi:hypothetical protein QYF36_025901 [Acer negundo]|nr:hypothetical protein QYF36_025901 [Acer negundo]
MNHKLVQRSKCSRNFIVVNDEIALQMEQKLPRRRIRNSIVVNDGAALQMEEKLHQTISLTMDAAITRTWSEGPGGHRKHVTTRKPSKDTSSSRLVATSKQGKPSTNEHEIVNKNSLSQSKDIR